MCSAPRLSLWVGARAREDWKILYVLYPRRATRIKQRPLAPPPVAAGAILPLETQPMPLPGPPDETCQCRSDSDETRSGSDGRDTERLGSTRTGHGFTERRRSRSRRRRSVPGPAGVSHGGPAGRVSRQTRRAEQRAEGCRNPSRKVGAEGDADLAAGPRNRAGSRSPLQRGRRPQGLASKRPKVGQHAPWTRRGLPCHSAGVGGGGGFAGPIRPRRTAAEAAAGPRKHILRIRHC